MKLLLAVAALVAIASATFIEVEENQFLSKAECKKWAPKVWKWINDADTNNNGRMTKWEEWRHFKKTMLAPKWNAWLKKHGHKLSSAGKKAYWQKRRAFMKKQKMIFMRKWAAVMGKKNSISNKKAMMMWWRACLKAKHH